MNFHLEVKNRVQSQWHVALDSHCCKMTNAKSVRVWGWWAHRFCWETTNTKATKLNSRALFYLRIFIAANGTAFYLSCEPIARSVTFNLVKHEYECRFFPAKFPRLVAIMKIDKNAWGRTHSAHQLRLAHLKLINLIEIYFGFGFKCIFLLLIVFMVSMWQST